MLHIESRSAVIPVSWDVLEGLISKCLYSDARADGRSGRIFGIRGCVGEPGVWDGRGGSLYRINVGER